MHRGLLLQREADSLPVAPMDYLSYFDLTAEPFSNAPLSRFYFGSRQHADALERLKYGAATMKGLAILVGDIGLGKTTLARRLLESLPDSEYEAAMLVMVHAGITPNWLLKRIAIQLAVPEPADDKLTILSQLYQRLVEIHRSGRKAVVLIDEAQMLASRELMEEFRGLLNLEVPDQKLISFIFFGLPEIEQNLRLDPPLAQRIALRCRLAPLGLEDSHSYVRHRLALAGGDDRTIFSTAALDEIYRFAHGVPRLTNTLCDNVLLEMFFAKTKRADPELVGRVATNLGMLPAGIAEPPPPEIVLPTDEPARAGSAGFDAMVPAPRDEVASYNQGLPPGLSPDDIAAQVLGEPTIEESPLLAEFEAADTAAAPEPTHETDPGMVEEPLEVVPEPAMLQHGVASDLVVEPQLPEFSNHREVSTSAVSELTAAVPSYPASEPPSAAFEDVAVVSDPESVAAATHLPESAPDGPSPWRPSVDSEGLPADVPELAATDLEVLPPGDEPSLAATLSDETWGASRVAPLARALSVEATEPSGIPADIDREPAFASVTAPLPGSLASHEVEVDIETDSGELPTPEASVEVALEADVEVTIDAPNSIMEPLPAIETTPIPAASLVFAPVPEPMREPPPVAVAPAAVDAPEPTSLAPVVAKPIPKPAPARPASRSIDLAEIDALLADLNLAPKKK